MESEEYLASIASETESFVRALESGDGEARVPACPDWTLLDLAFHLGEVHRFWAETVEAGGDQRPDVEVERPPAEATSTWLEEGVEALVDVLEEADDADECWTWWGRDHVRRVKRRMALETAVHRWDAQDARDVAEPLDPALAVEGIQEYIDVFIPANDEPWPHEHATIHLHRTDGRGNWQFTLDPSGGERRWARDDAAIMRASASDLLLVLWGRVSPDEVTITGDTDVVRHLIDHVDLS